MAKSWESLKAQHDKIHGAMKKITPPSPSDRFEELRAHVVKSQDAMAIFLENQITGGEEE